MRSHCVLAHDVFSFGTLYLALLPIYVVDLGETNLTLVLEPNPNISMK